MLRRVFDLINAATPDSALYQRIRGSRSRERRGATASIRATLFSRSRAASDAAAQSRKIDAAAVRPWAETMNSGLGRFSGCSVAKAQARIGLPDESKSAEGRLPDGADHFYDLELDARKELVEAAIRNGETLVSRWMNLEREQTDAWLLRARRAADMLGARSAVVDLGCGLMTLERFLAPGTTYIPVDVVSRDVRTIVVDLNKEPLPAFDAESLVALGLLEYIYDVPGLLARMAGCYRTVVLSYNAVEGVPDRDIRIGHAWVNHFDLAEFEGLLMRGGLRIEDRVQHDATQTMWKLAGVRCA